MKNFLKKIVFLLAKEVPEPTSQYSVECGLAVPGRHYDHHGQHAAHPSPCNDPAVQPITGPATIVMSHMDADSWIGVLRLLGQPLPPLDLGLLEKLDCNGSSAVQDPDNCPEVQYAVGLELLAENAEFPRCEAEPQDISQTMQAVWADLSDWRLAVQTGKDAMDASERCYKTCACPQMRDGRVGLWLLKEGQDMDPSRPYRDGVEVVVVWRECYHSISIYCSPKTDHVVGGKVWAGLQFFGHPKACGTERGKSFTFRQAEQVQLDLALKLFPEA